MSKYQFNRLSGESFEQLAQALLDASLRTNGHLIQFGPGKDGSREATWEQPISHPEYTRPANELSDVPKIWVFQAKFHDISLRGSKPGATAILQDLKSELEKLVQKHNVKCHKYILITNVTLSGARNVGTRDQAEKIALPWKAHIPEIEIWDATDLSRMLDCQPGVRSGCADTILPGDILSAIFQKIESSTNRRANTFRAYLKYIVDNESQARAEEAGDDDSLQLSKIFIDQSLRLDINQLPDCYRETVDSWRCSSNLSEEQGTSTNDLETVPSSFALLWAAEERNMLLAGPGYGKSTITQFLALYHACRILNNAQSIALAARLKLPNGWTPEKLDSICPMRFPLRIELRRYAKWRKQSNDSGKHTSLASYIANDLIGKNIDSTLVEDDIFYLANKDPILLILDGLDEVPNKESRDEIIKECNSFIYRCTGEDADLQIIMSTRPQGYHGEFEKFEPLRWVINDLSENDFKNYCSCWLAERIKSVDERSEAEERIRRGMRSDAVKRLATTLLQATVMLTIARRKSDIPEERHKLFSKYVDVVFQREKTKSELIGNYEHELRRLHEMVGYRLHEAVARGEDDTLPARRFQDFVREIWHSERGDQHFTGVPNSECDQIIQLATDRLVFLTGKGEHQTDIDFVIQSYREFFAAQYLHLHTSANPNKVFDELVTRGAFWANVLQFYTALATPAQQWAWLHKAKDPEPPSSLDREIESIEYKRATLLSLPEYSCLKIAQIKDALSIVFSKGSRWTWTHQTWAISTLSSLRSGFARKFLLEEYLSQDSLV